MRLLQFGLHDLNVCTFTEEKTRLKTQIIRRDLSLVSILSSC